MRAIAIREDTSMVQQIRQSEPQYSCIVPIGSITGNADEEMMTFGVTAEDASNEAKQLLASRYGCSEDDIAQLLQQGKIEAIAQWCSSD
jgi:hypothetical protein